MSQCLPYADFKWEDEDDPELLRLISETGEDASRGYLLECTFSYPAHLHDLHADFPLAPLHGHVETSRLSSLAKSLCKLHGIKRGYCEKLLCTLEEKSRYVLHYRCFQLYCHLGLKLEKVHKILSFKQAPILRDYIALNTKNRVAATNLFDSNYYKLLSNSLYGKTMECADLRTKIDLVTEIRKYERIVSRLTFKSSTMINKHLVSLHSKYPFIKMNKPIYLGMVILDLAKYVMYFFHYLVMHRHFGAENVKLLYTDTDSFIYEIKTTDVYKDFKKLGGFLDFSNYPDSHFLYDKHLKKIPGLFKDECAGNQITSFVGLRSKMYSFRVKKGEDLEEKKVGKGIKKHLLEQDLTFEKYMNSLFRFETTEHEFSSIGRKAHTVFTLKSKKTGLSPFDDKRYLLSLTESLPYGHREIAAEEESLSSKKVKLEEEEDKE